MKLKFEPISLERQQAYARVFSDCDRKTSDYSFLNIWGWSDMYGLEWAWEENLVWIRQQRPEIRLWAPVGRWSAIDWQKRLLSLPPDLCQFIRVPDMLSDILKKQLGGRVHIEETREHHDYIYSAQELMELKGNRFHKKKNLYSQFIRNYTAEYRPLGQELLTQVRAMQIDWCGWRDCESQDTLSGENQVIERLLTHWDSLYGILGGTILVEEAVAAYTIGEMLDNETVVIHVEKGNPEYKGIYQAINRMFLTRTDKRFRWVNREQDLGDEGLRKAKMSYHPVELLRKYRVLVQPT